MGLLRAVRRWLQGSDQPQPGQAHNPAAEIQPTVAIAPMTWDEARWMVELFSNGDDAALARLKSAEVERWSPDDAVAEVLVDAGYLRILDRKFAGSEVTGHYSACLELHGLPRLDDDDADRMHALDPFDKRQEHLFFPDLAAALDDHATSLGWRLLGGGEHDGTSYILAVVTLEAFEALVGNGFGPLYFFDVAEEHPRPPL